MTTLDLDNAFTATTERQPGQFHRHPTTGAPYVTHPTDTTKNGEPKKVMYGRPSGLGKQVENTVNLQKWSERMVALGLTTDPDLRDEALALAELDQDSPEFKTLADTVAVKAKNAAQAHLAADRGTHHHALTEDHDLDRDPVERMSTGENLGVPRWAQHALLDAWALMLHTHDLEILATEATVVDDLWRQAGTLDRVARLRKPLRFVLPDGEIVTLPAGLIIILDIKTGRLRVDERTGRVAYWLAYAVQLASYAQAVPYDPDTGERGTWGFQVDQKWAVIAHLDVLAALAGEAVCRLILVDLEAGRHGGQLCVDARAWEKRCDVFSVPSDDLTVRVAATPPDELDVEPPADAAPVTRREWVLGRIQVIKDEGLGHELTCIWPDGVPGVRGDHRHTNHEIDLIHQAVDLIEQRHQLDLDPDPVTVAGNVAAALDERRARLTPPVGDTLTGDELAALRAEVAAAPATHQKLLREWLAEANAAGVGFSASSKPTARNRAILRAGLALADLCDGEGCETDLAVAVLAALPGLDGIPKKDRVPGTVGMTLGLLTVEQADAAVELAKRAPGMALKYVAGRPRLVDQIAS